MPDKYGASAIFDAVSPKAKLSLHTPTLSRSFSVPQELFHRRRNNSSERLLNSAFYNEYCFQKRVRVPYKECAPRLIRERTDMLAVCAHLPMQSHPRALLSDTGRALFIGDLRFAAKLCLFLRIKFRSRTDGVSLDGAESAARRKERERDGMEGWRVGSGDPPSFHIFTE